MTSRNSLRKNLARIVGPSRVFTDAPNRLLYSADTMTGCVLDRKAGKKLHLPDVIVRPKNAAEVMKIVKLASRTKTPIVPYGAGSGVAGGTVPLHGGIVLDLSRMNAISPVVEKNGKFSVTAEAGVIGHHLELELNEKGYTMGHYPSSLFCASIGGYLAARSAGQLSSKYGKIEDMAEGVEVVLPSGRLVRMGAPVPGFPKIRSQDLFIGNEGTLGILTRGRFRVFPLPETTLYRGVLFANVAKASEAIRLIMQSGLKPSVVRLYDPLDTILLRYGQKQSGDAAHSSGHSSGSSSGRLYALLLKKPTWVQKAMEGLSQKAMLVLAFEGEAHVARAHEAEALEICLSQGGRDQGEGPGLHWLNHRYSASFKLVPLWDQDAVVDTIEVATTWDRLMGLYDAMRQALMPQVLTLAHFSHAYPEGCSIYFTLVGKKKNHEENRDLYVRMWRDAMEACLKAGGTISHHHGIGFLKGKFLPRELGAGMDFYRTLKKKLDPKGIMNPGKMGLHA